MIRNVLAPLKKGRFLKSENGAVSVDFVMWMPVLMAILIIATDATMGFMRQSHMWQTSREAARIVSRYGMDEATAEAYVKQVTRIGDKFGDVDVAFTPGEVSVTLSMETRYMLPFNSFGFAIGDKFTTHVTHTMEPI